MPKTKTQGATPETMSQMLLKSKRNEQAAANEQEFAMMAMNFFYPDNIYETINNLQLATTSELADFLENMDEKDPEWVPDEIMNIVSRGHSLVAFITGSHDLLNRILKQQTNERNHPLPAGPAARA